MPESEGLFHHPKGFFFLRRRWSPGRKETGENDPESGWVRGIFPWESGVVNRHSHIIRDESIASVTGSALQGGGIPAASTTAIRMGVLIRLVPGLAAFVFGTGDADKRMSRLCQESFTLRPEKAGAILSPSIPRTGHHLKHWIKTFPLTRAVGSAGSGVFGWGVAGEIFLPRSNAV